jgi:hypothetical protein
MLGKKDFANGSGNLCEGIANTPNDNVLEWSGDLDEGRALRAWSSIALTDKAVRELNYCRSMSIQPCVRGCFGAYREMAML